MQFDISGGSLPVLTVTLNRGETIKSEAGGKSWILGDVHVENNSGGSGVGGMLGRMVTGESVLFSHYTANEDGCKVAFSNSFPGEIVPLHLNGTGSFIAQKHAMLCMDEEIQVSTYMNNLGTSFFGGEGMFMQEFHGTGDLFLEIDGSCFEYELAPGETINVDTGLVAAFESSVKMDIQRVKGVKNIFFGGEGLFNTTLTGPGKIYIQSMSMMNLANGLRPYFTTRD